MTAAKAARLVDGWAIPNGTAQHWLVQLVIFSSNGREPRLVCFRNGVRALFSLSDVEVDA